MSDENDEAGSDMQMSESDPGDDRDDVDMDAEDDNVSEQDAQLKNDDSLLDIEDEEPEEEEEEEEEDASESDELSGPPSPVPVAHPRLKIKLRLPAQGGSSSNAVPSTVTSTPTRAGTRDDDEPIPAHLDWDAEYESEEEDEPAERAASVASTSIVTSSGRRRPMTARQAVLASFIDSPQVQLPETSRKKKQLNDAELALRREETARKRRNLSEKKLEDEKAETINRLLKKQSRPRNKRNPLASAEDRTPATPPVPAGQAPSEAGGDAEAETYTLEPAAELAPAMYRWVSSAQDRKVDGKEDTERAMVINFSVPLHVLPMSTDTMEVDSAGGDQNSSRASPVCSVGDCPQARKYRWVKDWTKGACGMAHLKMLDVASPVAA